MEKETDSEMNVLRSALPTPKLSLLEQLQLKRQRLQPTTTKFIKMDGSVTYFENQGKDESVLESDSSGYGFVVDTKPDLTHGEILPWLFVSSQDVPQELSIVKELDISHILSLLPGFNLNTAVQRQIKEHLVLEFYDEETFSTEDNSSTMNVICQAIDFICGAKSSDSNHKVLIHCNAGLSRAPTIAILYLMRKENFCFNDAWKLVRSVRQNAKPNRGFLNYILATTR